MVPGILDSVCVEKEFRESVQDSGNGGCRPEPCVKPDVPGTGVFHCVSGAGNGVKTLLMGGQWLQVERVVTVGHCLDT